MAYNVTLKTLDEDGENTRNVTLWQNLDGSVSLLGELQHGTKLVIDQNFVDSLQLIVDHNNGINDGT